MKTWLMEFWNHHGERLLFMAMAMGLCAIFWFLVDMADEAKMGLNMIFGILISRMRSPREKVIEDRTEKAVNN